MADTNKIGNTKLSDTTMMKSPEKPTTLATEAIELHRLYTMAREIVIKLNGSIYTITGYNVEIEDQILVENNNIVSDLNNIKKNFASLIKDLEKLTDILANTTTA